jgi:hypothetical protein
MNYYRIDFYVNSSVDLTLVSVSSPVTVFFDNYDLARRHISKSLQYGLHVLRDGNDVLVIPPEKIEYVYGKIVTEQDQFVTEYELLFN